MLVLINVVTLRLAQLVLGMNVLHLVLNARYQCLSQGEGLGLFRAWQLVLTVIQ